VREGAWLGASKTLARSLNLVRSSSYKVEEENIRILPAIKLEMMRQQQNLVSVICQQWKESVVLSKQGEESSIVIKFQGEREEPAKELLQAMYFSELLEEQLVKLTSELKRCFLEPIMSSSCQLNMVGDKKLVAIVSSTKTPVPGQVFQQVKELFQFLFVWLEVPLDPHTSLMAELSPHLSVWLCEQLVRLVLAPAVPDTPDQLHTYEEVVTQTEDLHDYLVNIGLVAQENKTILNYARNVDAIFASKVCENMLADAREIMKKDLYLTAEVGPGKPEELDIPLTDSEDLLAIPPNFPLPSTSFQFPACLVSKSALELLSLAESALDSAATAKPFCAIRIFHTVRNIFTLWCAVTPTYHASSLSSLPQLAALAHNSAMYLAHKLTTLGFTYKDKLSAVSEGGVPTLVDLVPKLREVGADTLLSSLRLQRDQLKQILNTAGFPALATDRRLSSGAEQGIKQVLHTLGHLQKVWGKVLPGTVYLRCQGTLLNTVLEELIQIITSLEDISADAGGQLVSLLSQLVSKAPSLFPSEDPGRFVKRWGKFRELIFMLGATLREIEERWGGGKGKLGEEFPAEQVKQMVRALFQNTERRAAVLAKIK
jgi:centromere/kinetochore protein ZW10